MSRARPDAQTGIDELARRRYTTKTEAKTVASLPQIQQILHIFDESGVPKRKIMQRDTDMIRDLLLEIEAGKEYYQVLSDKDCELHGLEKHGLTDNEVDKIEHHLNLINDRRLVEFTKADEGRWIVDKITWEGHDFIDSVRDSAVWAQTKAGVEKAGGFTFDVIVALAKGLLKTKLEKHTGLQIDL